MDKRRKTSSGLGTKILLGALVISFAVTGMLGLFSGQSPNTLVKVGSRVIPVDDFRRAFSQAIQQESLQRKQALSAVQARQLGLDQQVLSQLITEAVLDETARDMGLEVSDAAVANSIFQIDAFKGVNGHYSPERLAQYLRNANTTEAALIEQQRTFMLRQQLVEGLGFDRPAPKQLLEAVHAYQNETRSLSFIIINDAMLGDLADPDADTLETYFNERKARFSIPELRNFQVVHLNADTLKIADSLSPEDVRARYEATKATYTTPEKRTVQRIVFKSMDEANGAAANLASGMTFEQIIASEKLKQSDVDLGLVTKSGIVDSAVADVAFSLPLNDVSPPVAGRFAPALVRVTAIEPAVVKSFDEVESDIRAKMVADRARSRINQLHTEIEKLRATGAKLSEVTQNLKLPLTSLENVDAQGLDAEGQRVNGAPDPKVLSAVFESGVDVDNDAIQISPVDYVWFDVTGMTAGRERSFTEARSKALDSWRAEEKGKRLDRRTAEIVEALNKGETLAQAAEKLKVQPQNLDGISRALGNPVLSEDGLSRVFATHVNMFGSAQAANAGERLIFQVTKRDVPPFDSAAIAPLAQQLARSYESDILDQYLAQLRNDVGVDINSRALAPLLGTQLD
jgi:peptidyl-prolyl cis-trans isomerase D